MSPAEKKSLQKNIAIIYATFRAIATRIRDRREMVDRVSAIEAEFIAGSNMYREIMDAAKRLNVEVTFVKEPIKKDGAWKI